MLRSNLLAEQKLFSNSHFKTQSDIFSLMRFNFKKICLRFLKKNFIYLTFLEWLPIMFRFAVMRLFSESKIMDWGKEILVKAIMTETKAHYEELFIMIFERDHISFGLEKEIAGVFSILLRSISCNHLDLLIFMIYVK